MRRASGRASARPPRRALLVSAQAGVHAETSVRDLSFGIPQWLRKWLPWGPSAPADPTATGPLSQAREAVKAQQSLGDIAKLAAEMQKIQKVGGNPMGAVGKDHVLKMEDLLAYQKKMSAGKGGPENPMLGMMQQQLDQMKKMQQTQQAGGGGGGGPTAIPKGVPSKGGAQGAPFGRPQVAKGQAHRGRPLPQPKAQASTDSASSSAAQQGAGGSPSSSPSGASATPGTPPQGQVDLGPEVEALFAELRQVRAQKNEFKKKLEATERQLLSATADVTRLSQVETDLRSRLSRAEKDVSLLNTESVALKEQLKEHKEARKGLQKAQNELSALKRQSLATEATDSRLKLELQAANAELHKARRRMERLRKVDPVVEFAMSARDVISFAVEYSGAESAATSDSSGATDETIQALHGTVADSIRAHWQDTVGESGKGVVSSTASGFWGAAVPHSRYDAQVTVHGDTSHFIATIDADDRCKIEEQSQEGDSTVFVLSGQNLAPNSGSGPTAFARAYEILSKHDDTMSRVHQVSPLVSSAMLKDDSRCTVDFVHSRSSGPGGQAANVSESKVTAALSVDGEVVARASSQESRSAINNTELAKERLLTESLARYNHSIARRSANVVKAAGAPPEARPLSSAAWSEVWLPLGRDQSSTSRAFDDVLLRCLEHVAVAPPHASS